MRSIQCIVRTDKAAGVLCGLLPGLSTLIAPGTDLNIELDTLMSCPKHTHYLLHDLKA